MTIIFDEVKYAEELIDNPKNIKIRDIYILGKYYRYIGYGDKKIESEISMFCKNYFDGFVEERDFKLPKKVSDKSRKYKIKTCPIIYITKSEIEKIKTVGDYRLEKILFTMIALSRYYRMQKNDFSEKFYLTENFPTILEYAHVYMKLKEKINTKHKLYLLGFLNGLYDTTKSTGYGKERYIILYGDEKSDHIIEIKDMNNLIKYYPVYCDYCGKIFQKDANNQKTCKNCVEEKRKIQTKSRVRKYRNNICNADGGCISMKENSN